MTDHRNKKISLNLLRHGPGTTGGDFYEEFISEKLCLHLNKQGFSCFFNNIITRKSYNGIKHLELLYWGLKNAFANINIVVARLALPALLRSRFTGNLTFIVLHNFDDNDGKKLPLKLYFKILFILLKKANPNKTAIITVSPFFKDYFSAMYPHLKVFMVPNLFNISIYEPYKKCLKNRKKIFLGQFSSKNDPSVFSLAELLTAKGYDCFFCTLFPEQASKSKNYETIYVPFEKYLQLMAEAYCTIAFTGINEGWNRLCHESILVGTPVIGYEKGGLGNLLRESNSYIVNSAQEAFELISSEKQLTVNAPNEFYSKFNIDKIDDYLKPLTAFIKQNAKA